MTDIHRRRSVRLKGYDYGLPRAYFVTLNTWQRACLFGEIVGGEMRLSPVGKIVVDELRRFGRRYPDWRLDAFVVMPNHVHMIVVLTKGVGATRHAPAREMAGEGHGPEQLPHGEDGSPIGGAAEGVGATRHAPVSAMAGEGGEPERLPHGEDGSPVQGIAEGRPRGPASGSLGMVIGQFKSRLTKCWRSIQSGSEIITNTSS